MKRVPLTKDKAISLAIVNVPVHILVSWLCGSPATIWSYLGSLACCYLLFPFIAPLFTPSEGQ